MLPSWPCSTRRQIQPEPPLVATALHWFPFKGSVAEVRRVLQPGGWLGLVYNFVMPVHDWEFELAAPDPDQKGATQTRPAPS